MSPSSCVRCSRLLTTGSTSGLCPVCLSCGDTSIPGGPTPHPNRSLGQPDTRSDAAPGPILPEPATVTEFPAPAPEGSPPITASRPPHGHAPVQPDIPPGYDCLRRLGGGGGGDVFLVREFATQRLAAIKFLRFPGSPIAVERFLAEVRALGKLNDAHIIRVLATDFYRLQPYFTMEYAPGGTLAERVTARGPLPPEEAAGIIATVSRAVQVAHDANIWHRDLKPSNILLAEDGTPRVTDFGLAKLADTDQGITQGTGPLGTPSYMPPEQVSSKYGSLGPGADVYGLGATLYQLVTGRAPFVGETPAQITAKVEYDPPDRPCALRPDLPAALEAIIVKCLEKRPVDRYASPGELADDLGRFLNGSPELRAVPLTRRRRLQRWVARRKGLVAGTAVVLLAIATAFVLGLFYQHLFGPPDPLDQMQRELTDGKAVTIIGKTGLPRWSRWELGPTTLGESPTGDGSCYFESVDNSMLEIFDSPRVNSYRITAELRLVRSRFIPPEVKESAAGRLIALYIGRATPVASDGTLTHHFLGLTFNDVYPLTPPPGVKPEAKAQLMTVMIPVREGSEHPWTGSVLAPVVFNAALGLPGEWRKLRFDVTPTQVRAYWASKIDDEPVLFATVPADEIDRRLGRIPKVFSDRTGGITLNPQPWSSQMPIGIWCHRAAITVRNVVIEPIPSP